ncbi:MAG TPA: adenylyltransferase/cytidyltransferase family protein [Patescibacteria group bacterium]|nr:adenylyltransferase/cytidyltransferase family protein [Patescibacteria group bacterium]
MKKVMVFGTFDGLHLGHLNFFKQAKALGDYLIIVVARDINVEKIKGRLPKLDENQRLEVIRRQGIADKLILGHFKDPYFYIKKEKPEIICLGYDQAGFAHGLEAKFPKIKIVRLKPYKPEIYKSSKLKKYD